jgi:acyl-CoA-dependent ceramide synthase
MDYHNDKLRQRSDSHFCESSCVDDLSICVVYEDDYDHSKQWLDWQRYYYEQQDASPTSLAMELLEHQLGLCVNTMLVVLISHFLFPDLRDKTGGFFMLSYLLDDLYGIGPQDLKLVLGFMVFFTATRAASLDYILSPMAARLGITNTKTQTRFAEQSYMIIYYTFYWSWGLRLFVHHTPAEVDGAESLLVSLWTGFPQLHLSASLKCYYISQLAFWSQQIAVLHLEHRRKDHHQMLLHHIVTIVLLAGSYSYRQWRAGNAVLVCMDLVDIILPLAKVLRYVSLQRSCDAAFTVFVAAWIITRHVFFLAICWSIHKHVHVTTMAYGTYSLATGDLLSTESNNDIFFNIFQPFLDPPAKSVAFNANIRQLFLGLLLLLQCITIAWFAMIVRVIVRMIRGEGATDSRSDDEGD